MDEGMNKLARVLHNRMKDERGAHSSLVLDFGEIQKDYSLLTNTYPIPIPKADYLVLEDLTLGETGTKLTTTTQNGAHTHGNNGSHGGHLAGDGSHEHESSGTHSHIVLIPEKLRWLKPGDRVLVAWVQHDAIVVGRVRPATDIG